MPRLVPALLLFVLAVAGAGGAAPSTFVDADGVLRWSDSRAEITQFGVNYTTPFAYAYRAHQALGIPWAQAIDADVYHFARLGLDAYRLHVWDREISDPDGNLVVNDHVAAFDHLLAQLEARGIKIILTPLQFGDASYPSPGEPLHGFSAKYGKQGCLEDRTSWPLQERYLAQFVQHVNPATGLAYAADPAIIGFEICNEPGHFDAALALEYINRMAAAIRGAGSTKPIFYNMSHGLPVHEAYLDANVQGGTFQWYPSNLVANHEQRGNFLPAVDTYPIPFADEPKFHRMARIVYEFDTADIGRSYLYPAMARTFRTAGFQFAAQFAYDPLYLAPYNTEYRTHFVNLAYAPQKALSLKIAGEAFHLVPRGRGYGDYPANTSFESIRLDYENDLAELVSATKFFHTNRTATPPPAPEKLEHIAGFASSPVVDYPGLGAYFLDRLEPGVWRLEVMPDALWVHDPFERASLRKAVSRIAWNEWPIHLHLPDLGPDFSVQGLNDGNTVATTARDATVPVRPGSYLLVRQGVTTKWKRDDRWENIVLKEFVAPPASLDQTYVLHDPAPEITAGQPLTITATVASPQPVARVRLVAYFPQETAARNQGEVANLRGQPGRGNTPGPGAVDLGGAQVLAMKPLGGLRYAAEIPADNLTPGSLRYHIVVDGPSGPTSFPSGHAGVPTDWDFFGAGWNARIVAAHAPILLFDAATDSARITAQARDLAYDLGPADRPGTTAMAVVARSLDQGEHDHSFRFFFRDRIRGRLADLPAAHRLVIFARTTDERPCPVQLALIDSNGFAFGAQTEVTRNFAAIALPLETLHEVRSPNLPHGYPVFIPFWSPTHPGARFDAGRVESVLVSIGPGLGGTGLAAMHTIQIEKIWLE